MDNIDCSSEEDVMRHYLPIYPRAFIASARFTKERSRVFVAMPFNARHSDSLWEILEFACKTSGFNIHRADYEKGTQNLIIFDILKEIEKAEIIIADLTGLNPNVLYEVGIAHMRCDSVILLCKEGQELPFNLSATHCIFYNLSTPEGKRSLIKRLGEALDALKSFAPPTLIDSKLERTKTIVEDLKTLGKLPDDELSKETIWFSGGLSALAIDEKEPSDPGEEEYQKALLEEKENLLVLVSRGCTLKCVLTPPASVAFTPKKIEKLQLRHQCLLDFLENKHGDKTIENALKNIDWAFSPYMQKHLYIIGHISLLEGYKKGDQRGYNVTLRQTGSSAISANILLYESLFSHLKVHTLTTYPTSSANESEREALRKAMIKCVKKFLKWVRSQKKKNQEK